MLTCPLVGPVTGRLSPGTGSDLGTIVGECSGYVVCCQLTCVNMEMVLCYNVILGAVVGVLATLLLAVGVAMVIIILILWRNKTKSKTSEIIGQ